MFIYVHRFPRYSSSFSVSRWLSEIILVQVALKFWSMSNLDCYCNIHTYPKKGKRETSLVLHTSESSSDVFSSRRLMTFRRYFWNPSRRASTTLESFKKKIDIITFLLTSLSGTYTYIYILVLKLYSVVTV